MKIDKLKDWRWCAVWGDSRDYLSRIPDNAIDLILTDPPYNLSKHSTGNIPLPGRSAINNDLAPWDDEDFNPEDWADEFVRILKPDGNLFIFTSYNMIGRWYEALDKRFDSTNFMIWHKTNPAPKIFKTGFLNSCEMIYTCWNKRHVWNFSTQAEMHNFLESPICMRPERLSNPKHPAQKPVSILKKIIEVASRPGDIVFDPFMGVGSAGVAAIELGRRYIGIEKQEDYAMAAKQRIMNKDNNVDCSEPTVFYGAETSFFPFGKKIPKTNHINGHALEHPLGTIIKWAGGKEKELPVILPNMPKRFNRFFDPFVGGGSVFLAVDCRELLINDLSHELIDLYRLISGQDTEFFHLLNEISYSWDTIGKFVESDDTLMSVYRLYSKNKDISFLKNSIWEYNNSVFKRLVAILPKFVLEYASDFKKELNRNIFDKLKRMNKIEQEKGCLPEKDLHDNIETALKGSLYMFYRSMYNRSNSLPFTVAQRTVLFFFIRNFAYSGMFRYNAKGEFNVPYGGIGYNSKDLSKKIKFYHSENLLHQLNRTIIEKLDFEAFLEKHTPQEDDFIFLDPPYDSEFSTYAQNEFGKAEQERLAEYLFTKCKAKWMLVIKNTDFIYQLYHREGAYISSFDKKYAVSFMNRNNREVTHLLITNYPLQ